MNITTLTGRITRDLELKGSDDKRFLRFNLAVDNPFKKDDPRFINCVAFGKTAEVIAKYCSKGNKIGVVGYIKTSTYENESGDKRNNTDIIVNSVEFLESKKDREENGESKREVESEESFPF